MTIKLLLVGKTDAGNLRDLITHYTRKLGHYNKFEIEILPDLKNTKNLKIEEQKQKEGQLILTKLNPSDHIVLLDENGKHYSSEGFSEFIQKKLNSGMKQLIFVIGGPYGFSEEVYSRAHSKVSLSKMTFSHQMVRLFFVEQLYRAFSILKNEPYHHR